MTWGSNPGNQTDLVKKQSSPTPPTTVSEAMDAKMRQIGPPAWRIAPPGELVIRLIPQETPDTQKMAPCFVAEWCYRLNSAR